MTDAELTRTLASLIGRRCQHDGQSCRILDLLPDEGVLIVEALGTLPAIQLDQYGRASHRAPAVLQIPIRAPGGGPSAAVADLLDCLGRCAES